MSSVRVQTAQNVSIEYRLASLGERLAAYLIDAVVIAAYAMVLVFAVVFPMAEGLISLSTPVLILLGIFASPIFLYHFLMEALFDGQSVGKRIMKIKVARLDGSRPTLGNYLLRWLLSIIDFSFYAVAAIICILTSKNNQRLGDMAAGTTVISLKQQSLATTPLSAIVEDYEPVFPEAARLTDSDVRTLTEVVAHLRSKRRSPRTAELAREAKATIELRLGLEPVDMPPAHFLRIILRDVNTLHHQDYSDPDSMHEMSTSRLAGP